METESPIITVIVPIYNRRKWLGQCIQSIQNQTLEELEILLIDDGSTDFSGEICDVYAERDKRIRVIHQRNQGVSAARNTGIRQAAGKFLMFCDSDDQVDSEWCEHMVKLAEQYSDAWICTGYLYTDWKGARLGRKVYSETQEISEVRQGNYKSFFKSSLGFPVWNQIFLRNMIQEKQISFDETKCYGEDFEFASAYRKEKRYGIIYNAKPLYHYRIQQANSLSAKFLGEEYFHIAKKEFLLMREWITQKEEKDFLQWQFERLGLRSLFAALDPRSPESFDKQLHICQEIISSQEFEECLWTAVTTGKENLSLLLEQENQQKAIAFLTQWAETYYEYT